jgi:hypothetical protein
MPKIAKFFVKPVLPSMISNFMALIMQLKNISKMQKCGSEAVKLGRQAIVHHHPAEVLETPYRSLQ